MNDETTADVWMPTVIGDYKKTTADLSAAEHGAYHNLRMHYWIRGPFPDNDDAVRRASTMERSEWRASRDTIRALFKIVDGVWHHPKLDAEKLDAVRNVERNNNRTKAATAARQKGRDGQRDVQRETLRNVDPRGVEGEGPYRSRVILEGSELDTDQASPEDKWVAE